MSSFFYLPFAFLALIISFLIVLFIWLGNYFNKKRIAKYPEVAQQSSAAIEGSVLGIMSLLLGFTFSVVVTRFETRRQLMVADITNVNTAILRCDLFPDSIRNLMRADFKEFLEARIAYYEAGSDNARVLDEIKKAKKIWGMIWKRVAFDSKNPEVRVRSQQMIPVLSNLDNSIIEREAGRVSGVPKLILWTLLVLVLITSFFLGVDFKEKKRNKILVVGYALVLCITLNLIIELNTPRKGLINLDTTQQKMIELRELFK